MLTAVKNQTRVFGYSIKYALMREMLNKATFLSNIIFMVLNDLAMFIQWIVLFSLKDSLGGYGFKEIVLILGMAAISYGISRFFFKKAFALSEIINSGKLDVFLVQPKNVLISAITNDVSTSALGDIIFGLIAFFIYGFSIGNGLLFSFFAITGGLILTSIAVIFGSLAFWFNKSDAVAGNFNTLMIQFGTYPDGIFKGFVKIMLFTLVPVGMTTYLPVKILISFNIYQMLIVMLATSFIISLAFIVFYRGLRRYSSSSLMLVRT